MVSNALRKLNEAIDVKIAIINAWHPTGITIGAPETVYLIDRPARILPTSAEQLDSEQSSTD